MPTVQYTWWAEKLLKLVLEDINRYEMEWKKVTIALYYVQFRVKFLKNVLGITY